MIHFINAFRKLSLGWKWRVWECICLECCTENPNMQMFKWVNVRVYLFDNLSPLHCPVTRFLFLLPASTQQVKHISTCERTKGVAGDLFGGLLCSIPQCPWEKQKGLDGTCGTGLTVTSLTIRGSRREEAKAEPYFHEGFFSSNSWERNRLTTVGPALFVPLLRHPATINLWILTIPVRNTNQVAPNKPLLPAGEFTRRHCNYCASFYIRIALCYF